MLVKVSQGRRQRHSSHTSDRRDDLSRLDDLDVSGKICMIQLMLPGGSRTICIYLTNISNVRYVLLMHRSREHIVKAWYRIYCRLPTS